MSNKRIDLITVTYNPNEGVSSALIGAIITNLPEGARLTEMSVLFTDHRPDVAELAINFTYTPERTDR